MTYRVVALGDSVSTGVGDTVSSGCEPGWVSHLGRRIPDAQVTNLAHMGARARDVLRHQAPRARGIPVDLVTILVGGNDVLRKDFSPARVASTIHEVCAGFSDEVTIAVILLHDPQRVLPEFSGEAGMVIAKRAAALNDEIRRAMARDERVVLIDISTAPGAHDLQNWHIDRMHPSPTGHRWLARVVAETLTGRRRLVTVDIEDPVPPAPARWIQLLWFIAAGIPWALKRSVDLLPELISVIRAERRSLDRDPARAVEAPIIPEMKQGSRLADLGSGDPDRARTGDLRRDRAAR